MSNKKAIEIIDSMIYEKKSKLIHEDSHSDIMYNADLKYDINFLKEIESRIQSLPDTDEWISVEDRLPEEGKYVLVCGHNYHDVCFYEGDGIFYDSDFYDNLKITHWQPLPNPPTTK